MRPRNLLWMLGFSLCITNVALAQSKTGRPQTDISARADDQFRKGRDEQDRGNCQKALEHFRESHALKPGRGTLLNMGLCEKKLGQLGKALQHFEELLPQLPNGDERRQIVRDALAEIKPKVPYLRIVLKANSPAGTAVTYDNAELEPTMIGTDMPVDPGKHIVVVETPGFPDKRYDVVMEVGKRQTLQVETSATVQGLPDKRDDNAVEEGKRQTLQVEPGIRALANPPAETPSMGSAGRTIGFIFGAVGAAGLVTSAITGGMALSDHSAAEEACPSRKGCGAETVDLANRGQTLSLVNTVTLAAGLISVGIAVPLIILGGKNKDASTVGVWVAPDGARFGMQGCF